MNFVLPRYCCCRSVFFVCVRVVVVGVIQLNGELCALALMQMAQYYAKYAIYKRFDGIVYAASNSRAMCTH